MAEARFDFPYGRQPGEISPSPPLTADELLELWHLYAPSEFVAQLRIDTADDHERRALDKLAVLRWKGKA